MKIFRRRDHVRPLGAGLTYCAGFDLLVQASTPTLLVIDVDLERRGGTDIRPPRRLASFRVQALPAETTLRVETDDGALGHPCAEVFRLSVSVDGGGKSELVITETQTTRETQVIGAGWTSTYPVFTHPSGARLEYRPLHGYLD